MIVGDFESLRTRMSARRFTAFSSVSICVDPWLKISLKSFA